MNHEITTKNGRQFPTPGDWSVNWVEGDVVSWRHGDDGSRVFDGATAHAYVSFDAFGTDEVRVDVNGETVERFEYDDHEAAFDRVGDILTAYAPD